MQEICNQLQAANLHLCPNRKITYDKHIDKKKNSNT